MNRRIGAGAALIVVSVAIGALVTTGMLVPVDAALMHIMSVARASSWLIEAVQFVSTFGDLGVRGVAVMLVFAALLWRQRWRSGAIFLATVATSIGGHTLAKLFWARERPRLVPWLDDPHDLSFPSGHAAGSMVVLLLAAMLFDRWRLGGVAIVLALAIGLTRPMLGVHWPTDIIGGWLWGAGFALIGAGVAQSAGWLDPQFQSSVRQ